MPFEIVQSSFLGEICSFLLYGNDVIRFCLRYGSRLAGVKPQTLAIRWEGEAPAAGSHKLLECPESFVTVFAKQSGAH
jgi:hypothetical protein